MARVRSLPALLVTVLLAASCSSEPGARQVAAAPSVEVPPASTLPPPPEEDPAPGTSSPKTKSAPPSPQARFKLPTVNGAGSATIEAGKVHVIHFWATFCAPCKVSMPALQKLADQYASAGLRVMALAQDEAEDKDSVKQFADGLKITFPVALDEGSAVAKALHLKSLPSTMILDRQGTVRFVKDGYSPADDTLIEKEVKGLL